MDYAHVLKDLADIHFPDAKTIVLVQDNLNIHSKASLYEAFPAAEARRLVERFEWHYTPKHGRPPPSACGMMPRCVITDNFPRGWTAMQRGHR